MTRARHIRSAHHVRCPDPRLLPALLMPAALGLSMLVLALGGRIGMDPRLAGAIMLGWSMVLALIASVTKRGRRAHALGPLAITGALVLPFLPVEVALVVTGITLFPLAASELEQPVCWILPGGPVTLGAHGVLLVLAASLLLLAD